MEREFKVGYHKKPRVIWFISLCTALFLGGVAHAAPQYTITCSSCHGMPPLDDAAGRVPETGAFKGNHATHLPSSAVVNNNGSYCLPCHNTAGYNTSHMSGQIGLQANINSSPYPTTGGRYMVSGAAVTFKNQTSIPVLGSCSNVNCHFETTTPTWGSAAYSNADADCNNCHSYPGGDNGVHVNSAAHAKHNSYYPWASNGCTKCHPDYKTGLKFNHATSAGNRAIKVQLTEGAYTGANSSYLPSQTGRVFGSCSNLYCHSSGQSDNAGAPIYRQVSWSSTLNCGSCHNNMATFANASSGSHKVHAQNSAIACATCHNGYTDTTVNTTTHVDSKINLSFSGTAVGTTYSKDAVGGFAPGSGAYGSCSTSVCHGSNALTWGNDTTNFSCTKCHGTPSTLGSNANMAPAVGAHQVHVNGATSYRYAREYTCYECHNSGATSTFTNHMNGNTQNVVFNNASSAADNSVTASWAAGTYPNGTCNVYCHGVSMPKGDTTGTARNPSWTSNIMTGDKANDCATCHGNPPASSVHNNKTATTSCYSCHEHFNNAGGFDTEINRRKHIDGALQAKGDCDSCHSYDTVGGVWSNGVTGGVGPGAHAKHIDYIKARWGATLTAVGDQFGSGATVTVCGVCHLMNETTNHMEVANTRNINFNGSTARKFGTSSPSYALKSCSNIDCHFKTSPVWY